MAYNNYFPATYQPVYPQQVQQYQQASQVQPQAQVPQNHNNGIIWIQGENAAKSYLVAAGNSVVLFDAENPVFYIKSADQTGMPSMKKFRFEEVTEVAQADNGQPVAEYITRDEFEKRLSELTTPKKATTARKETKVDG